MAKTLKIEVTAEGVETEDQARFLDEKRCDRCQGFHFSRPVPALVITTMLQKDSREHPAKIIGSKQ